MAATLIVTFDTRDIVKALEKKGMRAHNYREFNRQAAGVIARMVDDKFEAQGPGWPPLKQSTIARRRKSSSPRILQDSGLLSGSMDQRFNYTEAELSTSVSYAKFHLTGTRFMKKRDFFKINLRKALNLTAKIMLEEIDR